jgi:predicted RNase H-like nuclease (RuvC/YqgF family)
MDEIKNAAELVNSVLAARGYHSEALMFASVDSIDDTLKNDKAVLNVLYALLQELDKSKNDRNYLNEVLADKNEIIKHFETSNSELNTQNGVLRREINSQKNEIEILKAQIRSLRQGNRQRDHKLLQERNVNNSLRTKYEIDIKRKQVIIEKLQDKLLSKRRKYLSIIQGNNYIHDQLTQGETKILLDQELESMLVNLSDLINKLTAQNSSSVELLNFIIAYLSVLGDYYKAKITREKEHSPPTPQYFKQIMKLPEKGDIPTKISHMVDIDELQPLVMDHLNRLYESMTMDLVIDSDRIQSSRVVQLQQTVDQLQRNLDVAMETNEEWRKKFEKR